MKTIRALNNQKFGPRNRDVRAVETRPEFRWRVKLRQLARVVNYEASLPSFHLFGTRPGSALFMRVMTLFHNRIELWNCPLGRHLIQRNNRIFKDTICKLRDSTFELESRSNFVYYPRIISRLSLPRSKRRSEKYFSSENQSCQQLWSV